MFLSQLERGIFSVLSGNTASYNLTKNEWLAMRGLSEDKSIVIKIADKRACVVKWDRADIWQKLKTISLIAVTIRK